MNIWELFSEISDDIEQGNEDTQGWGHRGRGIGSFLMIIPHLIGALVGCAVARMFSLNSDGYIHLSILFALVVGIYKSCSFDKMSILRAFIKNVLIMLIFGAIFLIAYLIKSK